MNRELTTKICRIYQTICVLLAVIAGVMISSDDVAAGGINSNEARVLSVATGGFSYNNELYTARQEYVDQLIAYLCRDDVNLTESQADKAISAIYSNIETGVNEGYIVKTGSDSDDLDRETKVEISEVSPEERRQGINDVSELDKTTPAPGSISYSDEGRARAYNSEGEELVSIDGVLKNTGLSNVGMNISLMLFAVIFVCTVIFATTLIVSERRKGNES